MGKTALFKPDIRAEPFRCLIPSCGREIKHLDGICSRCFPTSDEAAGTLMKVYCHNCQTFFDLKRGEDPENHVHPHLHRDGVPDRLGVMIVGACNKCDPEGKYDEVWSEWVAIAPRVAEEHKN